jgi:hypothetical protein
MHWQGSVFYQNSFTVHVSANPQIDPLLQPLSRKVKDIKNLGIDRHCVFQQALAGSRKRYPTRELESFAAAQQQ